MAASPPLRSIPSKKSRSLTFTRAASSSPSAALAATSPVPFAKTPPSPWQTRTEDIAPTRLAALAKELSCRPPGNIGIAFTYNEPLLSFDYILDTAPLMHAAGLKVVLVTNGTICQEPRARLLPHIDAMNIDLKGWQEAFYRRLGGDLKTVKKTIAHAVSCGVHVEVTTLIIPGQNDSAADMDAEARWLASLSPDIPLHISRYFPCHNETAPPTPLASIAHLTAIARRHLKYVHCGNC